MFTHSRQRGVEFIVEIIQCLEHERVFYRLAVKMCIRDRGEAESPRRSGQQGRQFVELLAVFLFSYCDLHIQFIARLQSQVDICLSLIHILENMMM